MAHIANSLYTKRTDFTPAQLWNGSTPPQPSVAQRRHAKFLELAMGLDQSTAVPMPMPLTGEEEGPAELPPLEPDPSDSSEHEIFEHAGNEEDEDFAAALHYMAAEAARLAKEDTGNDNCDRVSTRSSISSSSSSSSSDEEGDGQNGRGGALPKASPPASSSASSHPVVVPESRGQRAPKNSHDGLAVRENGRFFGYIKYNPSTHTMYPLASYTRSVQRQRQ